MGKKEWEASVLGRGGELVGVLLVLRLPDGGCDGGNFGLLLLALRISANSA